MSTGRQGVLAKFGMAILLLGCSATTTQGAETHAALMEKYGLKAGMKVSQENAHLIKELVPEAFYRRLVAGDYGPLTIGEFNPPDVLTKVFPDWYYQETERHIGKYDVDADGGIIDKTTGERPWPMPPGLPFPQVDLGEDPKKAGVKIQWNAWSLPGVFNEIGGAGQGLIYSAPSRGNFDRYVVISLMGAGGRQYIDFRADPLKISRPISFQEMFLFAEPADAFGTVSLTWRWKDSKKWDSVWNYSPSVRRVRRLTAANRSDGVLGTEYVQDDSNLYNGKTEMFDWRYVGQRAMLMPVMIPLSQASDDYTARVTYVGKQSTALQDVPTAFESDLKRMTFPWKEDPQRYVSWWLPDLLWVPVWAYVVEGFPKDSYYNYGRQIFWYEATTFAPVWKEIYNRSGEYWRTTFQFVEFVRFEAAGKQLAAFDNTGFVVVDEKSNRGSVNLDSYSSNLTPGPAVNYHAGTDPEMFTMSKFLEQGK